MKLTQDDVRKVAMLSRLRLSDGELAQITEQLDQIVQYFELLDGLNTDDVEPMAHAMNLENVFANDELQPSLAREAALANAPKRDDECYRVPAVLGD